MEHHHQPANTAKAAKTAMSANTANSPHATRPLRGRYASGLQQQPSKLTGSQLRDDHQSFHQSTPSPVPPWSLVGVDWHRVAMLSRFEAGSIAIPGTETPLNP